VTFPIITYPPVFGVFVFHPKGIRSFSLGLRGTSYPRSNDDEPVYPERVVSIPDVAFVEIDFVAPNAMECP
jgi:hypothetical protein